MDAGWATIISSLILVVGGVLGTILAHRLSRVEKSAAKTEKGIKEISGNLPSWKLLLEHDENGKTITGDVQDLIKAVREGYPIKIRFDRSKEHFEVMDAQWLFVDNDKSLVHASNSSQVSLIKDVSGNYFHPDDPYYYFVIVNNTGYHHARRVYIGGEEHKPTESKRYMTWIGLVPPSP